MSCLLSKLNGEIDNTSLPKIGELIVHIENGFGWNGHDMIGFWLDADAEVTVEVIGDGTLSYGQDGNNPFTSVVCNKGGTQYKIYCSAGTYDVKISNKYVISINVIPIGCTNNHLLDFAYFSNEKLVGFQMTSYGARGYGGPKGTLADLKKFKGNINYFILQYAKFITGDLADLVGLKDADKYMRFDFGGTQNITGDVAVLAPFYNVTLFGLNTNGLKGDVANLLDGMHSNGRVSGTCNVILSGALGPSINGTYPSGYKNYKITFTDNGWSITN